MSILLTSPNALGAKGGRCGALILFLVPLSLLCLKEKNRLRQALFRRKTLNLSFGSSLSLLRGRRQSLLKFPLLMRSLRLLLHLLHQAPSLRPLRLLLLSQLALSFALPNGCG
jgi:hypothetical protein